MAEQGLIRAKASVRAEAVVRPRPATEWSALRDAAAVVVAFSTVLVTAAAQGGYFPTTWGWAALALGWVAAMALVLQVQLRLTPLEGIAVAGLAAFAAWIALSTLWSRSKPETVLEIERAVVYPLGLLAVLLVTRRRAMPKLLAAVLAATTLIATYSLATRLLPERIGVYDPVATYRLAAPLGYWNALGILLVMGMLLALGFVAHGRDPVARVLAAGSLVACGPTLYFTFGRGSWIALGFGLLVAFAIDPRRLRLVTATLLVAPAPATGIWLASRSEALTQQSAPLREASHDGHRLALWLLVLFAVAALATLALIAAERRLRVSRETRVAYVSVLGVAAVTLLLGVFLHFGGPATLVQRGWRAFTGPPVMVQAGQSLNKRLFSLSGNGRVDLWRSAWRDYEAHPWLGSGAGSYESWYLQHRKTSAKVRDAHSLYVEVLAELGPLGLTLLLATLAVPLAAAARARGHPLVPTAAAAYAAYLLHAGADWDWEMAGVTLTAICCGGAILVAARDNRPWAPRPALRGAALAAVAAVGLFAVVGVIANSALAAAGHAAETRNWRKEEAEARKAARWAPWSSEALRRLAEAQFAQGRAEQPRVNIRRAIGKDPRNWHLWLDLAIASKHRARLRAIRRALRLNPLSPEIEGALPELGLPRSLSARRRLASNNRRGTSQR